MGQIPCSTERISSFVIILTRDKRRHSSTNYDVFMMSLLKNNYVNDSTLLKI